jgi:hypothetical protein
LKRQYPKWYWLLWGILPLALLLAEATAAVGGASVLWCKSAIPQKAAGTLNHSQKVNDRGETAIVPAYPPPQPNGNIWNKGSNYFPGASAIFIRRMATTGQGFSFIALVIGLFAHFYGSARNNAGLDDGPHWECPCL